nr:palmitoyltransferase ZDHHC23 [Onthophagus taurus]
MSPESNNYLCCCEYIDQNNQINHILACCCDCQDFDEGMESLITGHGFPQHNKQNCFSACTDRLRLPWIGGAKRISPEIILSIIFIPLFLLLATNGIVWTILAAIALVLLLICMKLFTQNCCTNFFQVWINTSFIILYLVFELVVIPFLEILLEENIALTIVILLGCYWFWKAKKCCVIDNSGWHCVGCQKMVPVNSTHSLWLGYCIGDYNIKYYIMGLFAMVSSLLYGCNLTLTTVCHPFLFYGSVLLPDDCSYAYDLFELALSFVSGLYGLGLATFFSIMLLHQMVEVMVDNVCKRRRFRKTAANTLA